MKATTDDLGSQYLAVYLDGDRVERCIAADDAQGLAEIHEPRSEADRRTTFRRGQVEFRLRPQTPPEMQEALERHYGRLLERET